MVDVIKKYTGIIIIVSLFFALNHSDASVKEDLTFIMRSDSLSQVSNDNESPLSYKETSELKMLSMGLIRVYQVFISSQDGPVCNYTLSCSRFGLKAVKKYGFFHGILITSDRIQRCNALSRKHYLLDKESSLAIDYPLEKYYIGSYYKQ